jgi:hypothetical protein
MGRLAFVDKEHQAVGREPGPEGRVFGATIRGVETPCSLRLLEIFASTEALHA